MMTLKAIEIEREILFLREEDETKREQRRGILEWERKERNEDELYNGKRKKERIRVKKENNRKRKKERMTRIV